MQLRNLSIPAGAVFAPMAGLTDAACRHLMADHGAAWTVSEMASAKALNFHDEKSLALLRDKHPHGLYAIQLFGAEPAALEKAVELKLIDGYCIGGLTARQAEIWLAETARAMNERTEP